MGRNLRLWRICSLTHINLKIESLTFLLPQKYHEHFPTKTVVIRDSDKPKKPNRTKEFKTLTMTCSKLHAGCHTIAVKNSETTSWKLARQHGKHTFAIEFRYFWRLTLENVTPRSSAFLVRVPAVTHRCKKTLEPFYHQPRWKHSSQIYVLLTHHSLKQISKVSQLTFRTTSLLRYRNMQFVGNCRS